ncbi:MAG: hypothetical protein U0Z17_01515 [Bacteroidales bacterium]
MYFREARLLASTSCGYFGIKAGQLTFPASVIFPANTSPVVFNLNAVDNSLLDGPRSIAITAKSAGYSDAVDSLTILDDEVPFAFTET